MNNFWKISALILGGFLILSLAGNVIFSLKNIGSKTSGNNLSASAENSLAESVSAQEIYPLFECPCSCDQSLLCTCGHTTKPQDFIRTQIQAQKSKEEIILAYVQKYGLDSFMDEKNQDKFKQKLIEQAPTIRPIITINPASLNLGKVSAKQGVITTTFEIKNKGQSDLVIDKIETSCGCTSAAVVYQGNQGPKFSMPGHGINEKIKNWQVTIPAGDSAQLKVFYDPNFHSDFSGYAIRKITVFSNDPIDFQKKVKIELIQL